MGPEVPSGGPNQSISGDRGAGLVARARARRHVGPLYGLAQPSCHRRAGRAPLRGYGARKAEGSVPTAATGRSRGTGGSETRRGRAAASSGVTRGHEGDGPPAAPGRGACLRGKERAGAEPAPTGQGTGRDPASTIGVIARR